MLAVYPVGGWWKANKRKDRIGLPVSYALLGSLQTPEVSTDQYTPIATQLGVPVEIAAGCARLSATRRPRDLG